MGKEEDDRCPTGLACQNQTPGRREIHVVQLGHDSRQTGIPRAFLDRAQSLHAGGRLDEDKGSGIKPRTYQSTPAHPPMLTRQTPLAHPQAHAGTPGIPQSRQGQTGQGRKVAIAGLRQLVQAGLPQTVGKGHRHGRTGRQGNRRRHHCSVFVPESGRVKANPVPRLPGTAKHLEFQESIPSGRNAHASGQPQDGVNELPALMILSRLFHGADNIRKLPGPGHGIRTLGQDDHGNIPQTGKLPHPP